jgi:hypothetical protein
MYSRVALSIAAASSLLQSFGLFRRKENSLVLHFAWSRDEAMPSAAIGALLTGNDGAPVYKLPKEALVEIFRLSCRRYDAPDRGMMSYLSTISSVCQIWRYVALHEPSLWTTIIYNDHYDFGKISKASNDLPQKIKNRICSYLSRSQYYGLSIHIEFGTHGYGLAHIKNIIFPHLSRCHTLNLKFDSDDQALELLPLPTGMHRLIKLSCWVSRRRQWREARTLVLFSGTGHDCKLRDLTLRMTKMPIHETVLQRVIGGTLVELRLGGDSSGWNDIMAFLRQCHSLRKLKLAVRPPPEAQVTPFTLPNLICLQATNLEFPMAVHAPKLRSLMLFEGLQEDDSPVEPPLPSWRNLHTLRLMSVDPSRPDFIALLRANPTIKVLTIGLCDTDHCSLGGFGQLLLQDGPRIFPDKTNEPKVMAPSPENNGKKIKLTKSERKRKRRAEHEEYERKRAETEDSYKSFLPSLRLFQLSDSGGMDISPEYAANVLKRRPHLRFDGDGEVWDGTKVDAAQMGLIDEYPVAGDTWCT